MIHSWSIRDSFVVIQVKIKRKTFVLIVKVLMFFVKLAQRKRMYFCLIKLARITRIL